MKLVSQEEEEGKEVVKEEEVNEEVKEVFQHPLPSTEEINSRKNSTSTSSILCVCMCVFLFLGPI